MVSTPIPVPKQGLDPNLETYQLQIKYDHIRGHTCIAISLILICFSEVIAKHKLKGNKDKIFSCQNESTT